MVKINTLKFHGVPQKVPQFSGTEPPEQAGHH